MVELFPGGPCPGIHRYVLMEAFAGSPAGLFVLVGCFARAGEMVFGETAEPAQTGSGGTDVGGVIGGGKIDWVCTATAGVTDHVWSMMWSVELVLG